MKNTESPSSSLRCGLGCDAGICGFCSASGSSKNQVISRHSKALADQTKLPDVGERLTAFPCGNGGLGEVAAIRAHASAQAFLRKLQSFSGEA